MPDKHPLLFNARLGGLFPANRAAQDAMQEIKGVVRCTITGGRSNQKRRGLYWSVAALVVPLLNDLHNMTLDENDLHDITRDKLGLFDAIKLPSGEVHRKRKSTSDLAMNEAERSDYTNRALRLWSTWTGVDVTTLKGEAQESA